MRALLLTVLAAVLAPASAFAPGVSPARAHSAACRTHSSPQMGNNAPEGPFTPIVLAGKVVLGEKTLNKVRGKAISYHSQFITEFCTDYGVSKQMRGALIKKAKTIGGLLGFLS